VRRFRAAGNRADAGFPPRPRKFPQASFQDQRPRFVNATIGVISVMMSTMIQILPASRL
jgi:hypothetical protein